jgi:hypothetical protein
MTARRAQGVKSAAGEVVPVQHTQRAVELIGLLAVAANEPGGANAESAARAGLRPPVLIAAPFPWRAAAYSRAQLQPPSSGDDSISASAPVPQ